MRRIDSIQLPFQISRSRNRNGYGILHCKWDREEYPLSKHHLRAPAHCKSPHYNLVHEWRNAGDFKVMAMGPGGKTFGLENTETNRCAAQRKAGR